MNSVHFVEVTLGLIIIIALLWDVFLYADKVEDNTISQTIIRLSKRYAVIPFSIGFLMGHLFG